MSRVGATVMRTSVRRLVTGFLLVLALSAAPARAATLATHFRLALSTPPQLGDIATGASGDAYVVLQPWEASVARELKAANPRLIVLAYQNLGSMTAGASVDGLSSSGVSYSQARDGHPGWFLTTDGGAPIQEQGFPYLWMANVADPGYQRAWATDVLSVLRSGPWDGVFIDDVNASPYPESGDVTIRQFPDAAAYRTAVGSMLAYLAPRLRAAGRLEIINVGEWGDAPQTVAGWLRDADGAMQEQFAKVSVVGGAGYATSAAWREQLQEAQATQAMGRRFLAVTTAASDDVQAQTYGWASLLLVAEGRASYLSTAAYNGEVSAPAAYDVRLGAALGTLRRTAGGVWERRFVHGIVVVNPTDSTVAVRFGGTFRGPGLSGAETSDDLAAHTGLVLNGSSARTVGPSASWLLIALLLALLLLAWFTRVVRHWRARGRSPDR